MKVLAIETSNRPLSVAVLADDQILATTTTTVNPKHATTLQPIISDLMTRAGMTPADLDRVVVADGPGSYTGLRIGVTTAKVLATTMNIDLVGVSSIAAFAGNVMTEGQLVAVLFDARNDNLFAGAYRIVDGRPEVVINDAHTSFTDFLAKVVAYDESVVILGDTANYQERLVAALGVHAHFAKGLLNVPQAGVLGLLGETMTPEKNVDQFIPRYLRLTQAEAEWREKHPGGGNESYVEKV